MIRINNNIIELLNDNEEVILEQNFLADEFIWTIRTSKPIILTRDGNETFYDGLNEIMDNNYIFQLDIPSKKLRNRLVWLSDQYCDLEDKKSLKRINRLMIDRIEDKIIISVYNPLLEELEIKKDVNVIAFSPLCNGYFSRNINTGTTLQDDFVMLYQKLLYDKARRLK